MNTNQTRRYTVDCTRVTLQMLFDAAEIDNLDVALNLIQDAAGITDGTRAGFFFGGNEETAWVIGGDHTERVQILVRYLAYEKAASDINTLATESGQPEPEIVTITSAVEGSRTADLASQFVIYSANESALSDDGIFWSNGDGWTTLDKATVYHASELDANELPIATGNDATWMSLAEAYHGKLELLQQDGQQAILKLELSDKENNALLFVIGSFVDNEHAKGNKSGVDTLLDEMVVLEKELFDGAKVIDLNLLQIALVQRALMEQGDGKVDETQNVSGWDIAISGLIHRIGQKVASLSNPEYPNTYTAQFQCRCPVNSKVIHYYLVVESKTMIPVEQITELAGQQVECFHEPMAEMFIKAFPGTRQRLSAYHHGVHIKTIRSN